MAWHGYFGIENIGLNQAQRAALIQELRGIGPSEHPQPAMLMQVRIRPDGEAAIFEALLADEALTIEKTKNRLGALFSVDPDNIEHALSFYAFGQYPSPVVVFSYLGIDRLRMVLFGGKSASWEQSGAEARAYLFIHAADW